LKKKKITKFLEIVIHIGNFLNAGNKRLGACTAFEFETFAVLHGTKTSDNKQSMFEMITEMIKNQTPDVVVYTTDELNMLKEGVRLSLPTIDADLKKLRKDYDRVIKLVPNIEGDKFQATFEKFQHKAEPLLGELETAFEEGNNAYNNCVEQYGEDPAKKEPGEFFKVFEDFISKIIDVVSKIDAAKEKEQKAIQRELAKQKAGGTPQTRGAKAGTNTTTTATPTTRGGSTRGGTEPTTQTAARGSSTAARGSSTGARGGRGGRGGDDKVVENMFNALEGGNIFKQNRRGGS